MREVFAIIDNKKVKLTNINDIELTPVDIEAPTIDEFNCKSITFDTRIEYKQLLKALGITNNWLKYHGLPKWRRYAYKNLDNSF